MLPVLHYNLLFSFIFFFWDLHIVLDMSKAFILVLCCILVYE